MELESISLLDARSYEEYYEAHIPGSVPFNPVQLGLNTGRLDNSSRGICTLRLQTDGDAFAAAVEQKGVSTDKLVVVYDDGSCLEAAWVWWALSYHGHPNVRMLAGGWAAWQAGEWADSEAGDSCCPLKLQSFFVPQDPQSDLVMDPRRLLEAMQERSEKSERVLVKAETAAPVNPDNIILIDLMDDRTPLEDSTDEAMRSVHVISCDESKHDSNVSCDESKHSYALNGILEKLRLMGGCRTLALSQIMQLDDVAVDKGWCLKPEAKLREALLTRLSLPSGESAQHAEPPPKLTVLLVSQHQPSACLAAFAFNCVGHKPTVLN